MNEELPSYDSGHFPVGGGHRLYYERYGKRGGLPVLFVHGGPGAGFSEDDKRFFDPEQFDVLLYEQRGAGRSEPFASLEQNDTDALVEDIERLLDAFSLESVVLFGGSWGSTLSLVYAIRHPDRVRALVLRGIFLANEAAIRHFVGGAVSEFFPEVWERFAELVPEDRKGELASFYLDRMLSGDERERERYCYEWARYELALLKLDWTETPMRELLEHYNYRSLAPLEAHYTAHGFFLPEDYILRNAGALEGKPVSIVHGRYDMLCPPRQAFELHRNLPGSTLRYVRAGHSSSEEAIRAALIEELGLAPSG
ncbi:MAG TPA: prolyl aminopeptidase [Vicinamibacteria bacterium]|nr:prolyl aminopeptidase [Vicinamibacteria bacterium]